MSLTTEEQLVTALHDATRDLAPQPGLAAAAMAQSRRTRRRVVAGIGAVAIATGLATAVTLSLGTPAPEVVDGTLVEAPDWSGCAARLPLVNDDLGTSGLEAGADAVEVAVCGPVVAGDDEVTMDVHVAGAYDARRITRRVLDSDEGMLVEGCVYEIKCDTTFFALRAADGTVVRLAVTDIGRSALVADPTTSRVGAKRVLEAVQAVQASAPWHTYHSSDDPPPPLTFGDFECPDDVPVEDWKTYLASPGAGEEQALGDPIDRVIVCAYRPAEVEDGLVHVQVGIGYADDEAQDLVGVIEGAPVRKGDDAECNADAGLAYLVMAGSGDVLSRVLYAETFGCRVAGEVTPDLEPGERLAPRYVTDDVESALLAAAGPENL